MLGALGLHPVRAAARAIRHARDASTSRLRVAWSVSIIEAEAIVLDLVKPVGAARNGLGASGEGRSRMFDVRRTDRYDPKTVVPARTTQKLLTPCIFNPYQESGAECRTYSSSHGRRGWMEVRLPISSLKITPTTYWQPSRPKRKQSIGPELTATHRMLLACATSTIRKSRVIGGQYSRVTAVYLKKEGYARKA